uniref:Uncharacterized protein n=1 Tax=Anopheles atroparvus TaxID=41427 RepID=A0A182JFE9_ANOAO
MEYFSSDPLPYLIVGIDGVRYDSLLATLLSLGPGEDVRTVVLCVVSLFLRLLAPQGNFSTSTMAQLPISTATDSPIAIESVGVSGRGDRGRSTAAMKGMDRKRLANPGWPVLEQGRDGEGLRGVLNADVALVSSASISDDEDIGIASFPDVATGTLGVATEMPVAVFAALGAVTMVP